MSTNVVNLDALMPREDLGIYDQSATGNNVDKITIPHLNSFVFAPDLRKPNFQRETNQWSPKKVVELITAFIDRDLIPAVILWKAGKYIFVIDGAHRLSALLAWIQDDYGDGPRSTAFFGGHVPDEQRKIAEKTRKAVNSAVGSYSDYELAQKGSPKAEHIMKRLGNLSHCQVIAQWVPSPDAKSAEDSFFKINQAATPIDPTEKRILKARGSASAIAARAITNSGSGHKYWSKFDSVTQAKIESAAKEIHKCLYAPPIDTYPINTMDVPIAGQGYNSLPFVFDLVNTVNNVAVPDTTAKSGVNESLQEDVDGAQTLTYLSAVYEALRTVTTDVPQSLGLHPVVYFYTRGGSFKAEAFFAAIDFFSEIRKSGKLKDFHKVRADFEDYLIEQKQAVALIGHRFGTGQRSIPWLRDYYKLIYSSLSSGKGKDSLGEVIKADSNFAFLAASPPGAKQKTSGKDFAFSGNTKTAAYFAAALAACPRCAICNGRLHKNSLHIDHKVKKADGGHAGLTNAQVTHPWCDSSKG